MLKKIAEWFNLPSAGEATFEARDPGPMTPPTDQDYVFTTDLVQKGLMWLDKRIGAPNLLLTGPTGAGKSSFAEQLCARTGHQVWRVPCHGRMEFQELVGGFKLAMRQAVHEERARKAQAPAKGFAALVDVFERLIVAIKGAVGVGPETVFVHGALARAAMEGGVLLLDEVNFAPPPMLGALNTVADRGTLIIPETGEVIQISPDFHIAATGNSVQRGNDAALYRGTQAMNIAFVDRFLTAEVGYLDPVTESLILHRKTDDIRKPNGTNALDAPTIEAMIALANEVREMHQAGEMETTLSTRALVRWARVYLNAPVKRLESNAQKIAKWSLDFAHLEGVKPEERESIHRMIELRFVGSA